jgi:hypothetical protein
LHNPDCCCQQAFDFFVFLLAYYLGFCCCCVDAVQDALNKTTEDESEDNSGIVGTGAPMPDGEPPEDWDDKNNHKYKPSPENHLDVYLFCYIFLMFHGDNPIHKYYLFYLYI